VEDSTLPKMGSYEVSEFRHISEFRKKRESMSTWLFAVDD